MVSKELICSIGVINFLGGEGAVSSLAKQSALKYAAPETSTMELTKWNKDEGHNLRRVYIIVVPSVHPTTFKSMNK